MASFMILGVVVATLVGMVGADAGNERVWSSAAFIYHGERTPLIGPNMSSLTPLGAQQLYSQGSMFRARYLKSTLAAMEAGVTTYQGIMGIEHSALDNAQLSILSSTEPWVSASAHAFMQGLYPPARQAFAISDGGVATARLANGSLVDYPLGGYQYPNVLAASIQDVRSIWIEGHMTCEGYQQWLLDGLSNGVMLEAYNSTLGFYRQLWENNTFSGFPMGGANFFNAYDLYETAYFNYTHDNAAHLVLDENSLVTLRKLAAQQQMFYNTNTSSSSLSTIAGRTMIARVMSVFETNIVSRGVANKLNLMFGSFEPLLAFFALGDLVNGTSAAVFQDLPYFGGTIVFEMFSQGGNGSAYPARRDLMVRFLYRNSTDPNVPFVAYPLFGNTSQQSAMTLDAFAENARRFAVRTVAQWCDVCNALNVFCPTPPDFETLTPTLGRGGKPNDLGSVKPVVAGVVGAAVSVGVIGLAGLAAVAIGGLRVCRRDAPRRRGCFGGGGFKGSRKMPSDADVEDIAGRPRGKKERIGSWEMSGRDSVPDGKAGGSLAQMVRRCEDTNDGAKAVGPRSKSSEDDGVSDLDKRPITPREFS